MSESRISRKHHLPSVAGLFAFLLMVPLILALIGSLLDLEFIHRISGYAALPVIALMLAAFIANFVWCSNENVQIERKRKTVDSLLRCIQGDTSLQMLLKLPNQPELKVVAESGSYKINGVEAKSREEILDMLRPDMKIEVCAVK